MNSQSDQHYQDCLDHGGSYTEDGNDGWSCTLPSEVPTPTPTLSEATPS